MLRTLRTAFFYASSTLHHAFFPTVIMADLLSLVAIFQPSVFALEMLLHGAVSALCLGPVQGLCTDLSVRLWVSWLGRDFTFLGRSA
ncbi:hypothetical protein F4824DRAFT_137280 [Ustulina deusta]|nr:hypothetical protein F4824DRAFT_137280 [Ustulina deusta]